MAITNPGTTGGMHTSSSAGTPELRTASAPAGGTPFVLEKFPFIKQALPAALQTTINFVRDRDAGRPLSPEQAKIVVEYFRQTLEQDNPFVLGMISAANELKRAGRQDALLTPKILGYFVKLKGDTLLFAPPVTSLSGGKSEVSAMRTCLLERLTELSGSEPQNLKDLAQASEWLLANFNKVLAHRKDEIREPIRPIQRLLSLPSELDALLPASDERKVCFASTILLIAANLSRESNGEPHRLLASFAKSMAKMSELTPEHWSKLVDLTKNSRNLTWQDQPLHTLIETVGHAIGKPVSTERARELAGELDLALQRISAERLASPVEEFLQNILWVKRMSSYDHRELKNPDSQLVKGELVLPDQTEALERARTALTERLGRFKEVDVSFGWCTAPRLAEVLYLTAPTKVHLYSQPRENSLTEISATSPLSEATSRHFNSEVLLSKIGAQASLLPILSMLGGPQLIQTEITLAGAAIKNHNAANHTMELGPRDPTAPYWSCRLEVKPAETRDISHVLTLAKNLNFKECPVVIRGLQPQTPLAILVFGERPSRELPGYERLPITDTLTIYYTQDELAIKAMQAKLAQDYKSAQKALQQAEKLANSPAPVVAPVVHVTHKLQTAAAEILKAANEQNLFDGNLLKPDHRHGLSELAKGRLPSNKDLNILRRAEEFVTHKLKTYHAYERRVVLEKFQTLIPQVLKFAESLKSETTEG